MEVQKLTAPERRLIGGLSLVFFGSILNLMMFGIAIPQIRIEYGLAADTASWFPIVFNTPYILLMPFYGRLGDLLGKRRMLIIGSAVFVAGAIMCLSAAGVPMLIAGRIITGAGAAGIGPLCLSITAEQISQERRGKAIAAWNSFGPAAGILGPLAAGLLIEFFGWRSVFIPSTFFIVVSFPLMFRFLPKDTVIAGSSSRILRTYDWPGFLFFAVTLSSLVLFVSSRVVTGRAPLTDWRFLVPAFAGVGLFIWRERRAGEPFINLTLLKKRNFTIASLSVGIRMFLLRGVNFLFPLFFTEVYGYSATKTGAIIAVHSVFLLLTMRFGGVIADRISNRRPVMFGLLFQGLSYGLLAVTAGSLHIIPVFIAVAGSGAAAGLSIAALHHTAMMGIAPENAGAAAGLYSMIRFIGSLFGATVIGVVLENGIASFPATGLAYRSSFLVLAITGAAGFLMAAVLREMSGKKAS